MDISELDWVGLQFFAGGQSADRKLGTDYQFYDSHHIDFRKVPSRFSLLPEGTDVTSGTVTDLVLDMCLVPNGKYYAVGDTGQVYTIDTSGLWSYVGNIGQNSGAGIIYRADVDAVYITGRTKIARIKNVTTNPKFQPDWFLGGITTTTDGYKTGGSNSYLVQTSITEAANAYRSFQSDIEPLRKIGVQVNDKGTGDWTLTLHDDAQNVLATATILNANLISNSVNYFAFSSQVRLQIDTTSLGVTTSNNGRTYHFHLTSTVANGRIATTTDGSMIDCDFQLYADALVDTVNGLHPMDNFINYTAIANGRYVTVYEPLQDNPTTADFERHRLVLPPGFEGTGFAQKNLMLIPGAEQRTTDGKMQAGRLFFWDGSATTYNDWWPIPEGSPESLFSEKNRAYYVAGGTLYRIRGLDEPKEIRRFRGTDSEYSGIADVTHNYPHMMTVRRGILLCGYPSQTTITSLEHAVFSYGSAAPEFPDSFGNSYGISPGVSYNNGSNNLRLGMVRNYGDTLFISWRNGTDYGVDRIDNSSTPAATGSLESLVFDGGRPQFPKKSAFVLATFDELPADSTVTLKYRQDGATTWQTSEVVTSGNFAVFDLGFEFRYAEFGVDITCEGTTSPEVTSLYLFYDPMKKTNPVNHPS